MTTTAKKSRRWGAPDIVLLVALVALGIAANIGQFANAVPHLDLLVHFQVQYAWAFALLAGASILRRKWVLVLLFVLQLSISAARIAPWYMQGETATNSDSLRILSANVLYSNTEYDSFLDLVYEVEPDILVVQESSHGWHKALETLRSGGHGYEHVVAAPSQGVRGMILMSKLPIQDPEVKFNGPSEMPTLLAKVAVGEREMFIAVVHPIRPGLRHGSRLRDAELRAIAEMIEPLGADGVVIGDLNTTMWSHGYDQFMEETGLRNVRQGNGILPSWDRFVGFATAIPIDHCLVGGEVGAHSFELLEVEGSDHKAMLVNVSLSD